MTVINSMEGKDYGKAIERAQEKVLREYGIKISGYAKTIVPIDTGRLAGSITYQTKRYGTRASQPGDTVSKPNDDNECFVGTNVEYAQHVEYGTVRNPGGQPFLRPAVDIVKTGAGVDAALEIQKEFQSENASGKIAI